MTIVNFVCVFLLPKKYPMKGTWMVWGLVLMLLSCGPRPQEEASPAKISPKETQKKQLMFLYFEVTQGENSPQIILTQKQLVSGSIKENTIVNPPPKEGSYQIDLIDQTGKTAEVRIVEDPLNLVLEKYDYTETSTHQVELQKGYFSVRYNHRPEISSIKIYQYQQGTPILLFTENL